VLLELSGQTSRRGTPDLWRDTTVVPTRLSKKMNQKNTLFNQTAFSHVTPGRDQGDEAGRTKPFGVDKKQRSLS
jgi:hypothetical protein